MSLFRTLTTNLGLEESQELEIDRLMDAEALAEKSQAYDVQYQQVKQDINNNAEDGDDEDVADDDAVDGDDSDENADGNEPDEESEPPVETQPDAEEQAAMEELKATTYEPLSDLSMEDWETVGYHAKNISSGLFDGLKFLTVFGFNITTEYGAKLIKVLYKGVIWVLIKLAKSFFQGAIVTSKFIQRQLASYEHVKKQTEGLLQTLEGLEDPKEEKTGVYSNSQVINQLKVGESVNFSENIRAYAKFMDKTISSLSQGVKNDIGMLQYLTTVAARQQVNIPSAILSLDARFSNVREHVIDGYEPKSEHLVSLVSYEAIPGDAVLIAQLPKAKLETIQDYTEAYNSSRIIYGMDMQHFHSVDSVNYMTKSELVAFVQSLSDLNEMIKQHEHFYNSVRIAKKKLKISFGNYIQGLTTSPQRVGVRESLADVIYLRTVFIDKVYLVAAIDTHDYAVRVISAGLSFAKENMKRLNQMN